MDRNVARVECRQRENVADFANAFVEKTITYHIFLWAVQDIVIFSENLPGYSDLFRRPCITHLSLVHKNFAVLYIDGI